MARKTIDELDALPTTIASGDFLLVRRSDATYKVDYVNWPGAAAGDMTKAVYDSNDDGKVDEADSADAAPWTGITGKPSTFTPSSHTHPASEISSGTLAHERGGLEANISAYSGLVKVSAGATSQVTDNSTDWNTAYGWGNHASAGYLTGVSGSNAVDMADWPVGLDMTELGYVNGVTSAIQTQIDSKAATSHNHNASDINTGTLVHERGGLEADVSVYAGLLKISGGVTSQVTDSSADWNTAYGWGDHASGGYLTNITGEALSSLSDVTITAIAANELIQWSGSAWINQTLAEAGIQALLAEGAFVDGDKTKLDAIEASADVTDTVNVTAAGALMDSEVTNLAQVKAFSSADYATAAQGATADAAISSTDATQDVSAGIKFGGGTYVSTDTETDVGIVIEQGSKIYLHNSAGRLRDMLWFEESSDFIYIGQSNTTAIDGIELRAGTNADVFIYADTGVTPLLQASGADANHDLEIKAKGTGDITVGVFKFDADQTVGAGQDNYVLTYDNATGKISLEASAGGGGGSAQTGFAATLMFGI